MYIFTTIIQLLWVLDSIVAEDQPYNILRGSKVQTPTTSLYKHLSIKNICDFDHVKLNAVVFSTDWTSNVNLKVRIEAFDAKKRFIRSYEVQNLIIHPHDKKETTKKIIEGKKLCRSFNVKHDTVQNTKYFMIAFYNTKEWWCDVFTSFDFYYKEMDKCSEVEWDFETLKDSTYNSVDTLSRIESNAKWSTCENDKPVTLCEKKEQHFEVKARPMCYDGSKIYRITNYYNGAQLGSYMITKFRTEPLKGEIDGSKVCRLFRFQHDYKGNKRVFVQYFKDGKWNCQIFELMGKRDKYRLYTTWYGLCHRFRNYKRPKISILP